MFDINLLRTDLKATAEWMQQSRGHAIDVRRFKSPEVGRRGGDGAPDGAAVAMD